jgi:hypothetical protein
MPNPSCQIPMMKTHISSRPPKFASGTQEGRFINFFYPHTGKMQKSHTRGRLIYANHEDDLANFFNLNHNRNASVSQRFWLEILNLAKTFQNRGPTLSSVV